MTLDPRQALEEWVRPVLIHLDQVDPGQGGIAAERLLLVTLLQESWDGRYLRDLTADALGPLQIRPATHDDVWANFLAARAGLAHRILGLAASWPYLERQLVTNPAYAVAIARQIYRRQKPALPVASSGPGMWSYYKKFYNTAEGGARERDFMARWAVVLGTTTAD